MPYNYAYLIGVLLFFPIWLLLFTLRKDLKKEIFVASFVFGVIAFLSEPLFLRDYWNPEYMNSLFFGPYQLGSFEDFLYGFFKGGIAAVIYEEIFGKRFAKRKDR